MAWFQIDLGVLHAHAQAVLEAEARRATATLPGEPDPEGPARGAPFDMKPGLLGGPRHRFGKHGPYTIVPLRVRTPNARGGGKMPAAVYRAARRAPMGGTVAVPSAYANAGRTSNPRYQRKAGVFARMQRRPGPANKSVYLVFRTVSMRSSPASWWHPGRRVETPPQARRMIETTLRFLASSST
jgi:hypothetical protein